MFRGNCPKPRRLILRKVRRKLFQNERDRLQERRKELRPDSEYDIYTNDLRTEAPEEVRSAGNGLEAAQEARSQPGYASPIEKLKSLSTNPLYRSASSHLFFQSRKNNMLMRNRAMSMRGLAKSWASPTQPAPAKGKDAQMVNSSEWGSILKVKHNLW